MMPIMLPRHGSQRSLWSTLALVAVISGLMTAVSAAGESPKSRRAIRRALAAEWAERLTGWKYYLREPRLPLLMNDMVEVTRCKIKCLLDTRPSGEENLTYSATLWLEGRDQAPRNRFRVAVPGFHDFESLDRWMATEFSLTPLEADFNWPQEIKQSIRARYIALGMDRDMVRLVLGGIGQEVDLEQLDDGRVRETWKLQIKGDTRRIFAKRTALHENSGSSSVTTSGIEIGPIHSETATGTWSGTTTTQESGFFIFSGLPPKFLHIVFTDGKVTARRTEFLK